jgi:hypothetical protein
MKEQSLIEIKRKAESSNLMLQAMARDMQNIRDLAIGTLETIKYMPGYNEAIEKLKKDLITKQEEKKLELDVE